MINVEGDKFNGLIGMKAGTVLVPSFKLHSTFDCRDIDRPSWSLAPPLWRSPITIIGK
jgi:hypothetical protein